MGGMTIADSEEPGIPTPSGRATDIPQHNSEQFPVTYLGLGLGLEKVGAQVLWNMVARDGIEPPTPAFSGLRSTPELPGHVSEPAVRRLRGLFASR